MRKCSIREAFPLPCCVVIPLRFSPQAEEAHALKFLHCSRLLFLLFIGIKNRFDNG